MVNGARIAAAGMLAYGAWLLYRNQPQAVQAVQDAAGDLLTTTDQALTSAGQSAAEIVERFTMGRLRLSNMRHVTAADVSHNNVQAFFRVIRVGEGTADPLGYRRLVGGGEFESFADHPRIVRSGTFYNGKRWRSTAAGAYQFLASTWDETAGIMGLPDFTPANQDLGAAGRIAARGALEDVKAGRFDAAIKKVNREWASMPGSPFGQPVISWARARAIYAAAGGVTASV